MTFSGSPIYFFVHTLLLLIYITHTLLVLFARSQSRHAFPIGLNSSGGHTAFISCRSSLECSTKLCVPRAASWFAEFESARNFWTVPISAASGSGKAAFYLTVASVAINYYSEAYYITCMLNCINSKISVLKLLNSLYGGIEFTKELQRNFSDSSFSLCSWLSQSYCAD